MVKALSLNSMKHIILSGCFLMASTFSLIAQTDSTDLVAKRFIRAGDYDNAIVVLNHGLQRDEKNLTLLKDLAFTYYLQKNYKSAVTTARPLIERPDADVECYQILGLRIKLWRIEKNVRRCTATVSNVFPIAVNCTMNMVNAMESKRQWRYQIMGERN